MLCNMSQIEHPKSALTSIVLMSIVFALLFVVVSIEVLEMEEIAKVYVVPLLLTTMLVSAGSIASLYPKLKS